MLHHLDDPVDEEADPPELPERLAAKSLFRWEVSACCSCCKHAVQTAARVDPIAMNLSNMSTANYTVRVGQMQHHLHEGCLSFVNVTRMQEPTHL